MDAQISFKVYQVGLSRIRAMYSFTLPRDTTMAELYGMIAERHEELGRKAIIGATIRAYDPSHIGRYRYPGRVFTSDHPGEKPAFQLDKSSASRTIAECGITNGAELMYDNGEMD